MKLPYAIEPHNLWFGMTRYKNFVWKGTKYSVGDHVYITNDTVVKRQGFVENLNQLGYWVAKVLEIRASDENRVYARIYWMYSPKDLPRTAYICDIGVYTALGALQALLMLAFSVLLTVFGTNASTGMLRDAATRVLRAPMSFFDTTSVGRITNRFSRDVDVMDNNLTDAIRMFFFTLANVTAVFILTIVCFYYSAIALVPLYILYITAGIYYRASAREVKRSFAQECLPDSAKASVSIDEMNGAYYLTFTNQPWLSIRLDMIGNLLIFIVAILVVTSRFSVSPATGGLVLSYMLSIVQTLQFSIRQLAEVENGMNAVERLHYYGQELEEEAPLHTVEVRPSWLERGEIKFKNVVWPLTSSSSQDRNDMAPTWEPLSHTG